MTRERLAALVASAALASGCVSLPTRQELASPPFPHSALSLVDGRARFREVFCAVLGRGSDAAAEKRTCSEWLWRLGDEPRLEPRPAPEPDRTPQIYLVTGAFSECLGDEALPFKSAADALANDGYRIQTIVVSGRSSSEHNARQIAERLAQAPLDETGPAVLIGYSKGATDILEFLVRHPVAAARVTSFVSVAGAIAGSPLASHADGIYDALFDWVPWERCPPGDGGVLDSLSEQVRRDWLASHPLPSRVRYFSIAAFTTRPRMAAALVPGWEVLLRYDSRNDGQVLARDALIPGSTLLGYVDADHWSAAIDVESVHPLLGSRPDPVPFPRAALLEAILLQVAESRPRPSVSGPLEP